jgi:hypothetical protein
MRHSDISALPNGAVAADAIAYIFLMSIHARKTDDRRYVSKMKFDKLTND